MTEVASLNGAVIGFVTEGEPEEQGKNKNVNRYYCKSNGKSRLFKDQYNSNVWDSCLALHSGLCIGISFLRAPVLFT